ncbi:spindle pole body component 110 isoform X2 [Medicago truncatula]|uniref:spindle pole body component 110 isoform X2 n=1 Tax=Medicago truncatula TaxID=3880 RepID=UPI000D2F21B7|nr:spindle pole body component 110 isoform X2 [Medicago truncatula]
MAFKGSDNSNASNPVSYDDADYDDDVPLSTRLSRMSDSRTCSSNRGRDVPVKKRGCTTTIAVKRGFDSNGSSQTSVKKLKVLPYDNPSKDKDSTPLSRRVEIPKKSTDKSFSSLKKELVLVEKSFEECKKKKQREEERLISIKREIEECSIELGKMKKEVSSTNESHKKLQGEFDECVKDFDAKKAQLCLMNDLIGERKQELRTKETELRQVKDNIDKERKLDTLSRKIAECTVELKTKEKERDAMKKQIDEQAERLKSERKKLLKVIQLSKNDPQTQMVEFESLKKQFEERVKRLELKEKRCEERAVVLESKEKHFEGCVNEIKLKENQLKDERKEFTLKLEKFDYQTRELESEKKHFDSQMKEMESRERQFEGRSKQLEFKEEQLKVRMEESHSKEEQFKGQVKDLQSKENELDVRVKEIESETKQFEGQLKELQSKEKLLEGQMKEIQSIKEEYEDRGKELKSREEKLKARMQELKRFASQMEDFYSEEIQFEGQGKETESEDKNFKVHEKELKPKEKQFEGRMEGLESKPSEFDGQLERPELREKQYDALIEPFDEETEFVTSYTCNQLSPAIDERSLMLLPCEQTEELELSDDDILGNLQGFSDPSKVVLEIIQNPIIKKCKMGDDAVIIEDSHIHLLNELRRISPDIRPDVKEEAMKLALDLKANISQNNENSAAVLGFLLLLSIYGLVPSFDEEEVLKLFELVSQHNLAVELFGAMGFADKISDFVDNLRKREQYVEAVSFSCAFNLSNNNQLVDLLREHVQNAKLISESTCMKTNSIEIKEKAIDQEIASLEAVVQCIGDNNLESEGST